MCNKVHETTLPCGRVTKGWKIFQHNEYSVLRCMIKEDTYLNKSYQPCDPRKEKVVWDGCYPDHRYMQSF